MLIGIKNVTKLIGISVMALCAVLVCTLFLNFYLDIVFIQSEITAEPSINFYNAQVSTAKVVCIVSGGCLLITSVIMLLFYVKHYIDAHKKELGILKALGYSDLKIAQNFWVFGISVFIGAAVGFGGAFLLTPKFYELQNENHILPEISIHVHPTVFLYFVVFPTVVFAFLAIIYAWYQLKKPVLTLLKDSLSSSGKIKKRQPDHSHNCSFVNDLKRNSVRSKKTLAFFIFFASFCFSAMTQMSFSMEDLSSEMMGILILAIGLVLAFTTLFLAITTVVDGNKKTIAMMKVFGYSQKECCKAILSGYRPVSYIGFAAGTIYQYALLRIMVDIVFREIGNVPVYEFDIPCMMVSLVVFLAIYELFMYFYAQRIKKISVKEIMMES